MNDFRTRRAASMIFAVLALSGVGCDEPQCLDDSFVVHENGTCPTATEQRFMLSATACRVSIAEVTAMTGLPMQGAMAQSPAPLREGGFLLYSDTPAFRLCRARRVEFRLELACVDATGAPVCDAILTE